MMSHAWPIVLRGGLLSPRGYPPLYALMIVSHRLLRYAAPLLHLVAARRRGRARRRTARSTRAALGAQLAVLAAALLAARLRARPLLVARYYVLTTAVDRRRPVGPPAPRHAGRLGAAGGHALMRGSSTSSSPARRWPSASPVPARRRWSRSGSSRAGSPIYRQRRVGRDGRAVRRAQAAHDGQRRRAHGRRAGRRRRATRGSRASGALLRRTSLDELPNLVNVLRGEMAIVGPRPTVPVQVDRYTERQRGRLAVKPGITGWAQVNGAHRAALGRAHRARPLVHRAPLAARLDAADPLAHGCAWCSAARACTAARRPPGATRRPARTPSGGGLRDELGRLVRVGRAERAHGVHGRVVQARAGQRARPGDRGDAGVMPVLFCSTSVW